MLRVEQAISDLRYIQDHLRRARQTTCYRSASIGGSGLLALMAAGLQPFVLNSAELGATPFFVYWTGVAALAITMIGSEILYRYVCWSTPRARQQTLESLAAFLPCVLVGGLVSGLIIMSLPQHAALLPGLWGCIFSLGMFASRERLPSCTMWVAVYYLLTGLCCIRMGQGDQAFAPWTMGLTFGIGQLLTSACLYWSMEIPRAETN